MKSIKQYFPAMLILLIGYSISISFLYNYTLSKQKATNPPKLASITNIAYPNDTMLLKINGHKYVDDQHIILHVDIDNNKQHYYVRPGDNITYLNN